MQPNDLNTTEHYVSNIQNLTDLWMAMGTDTIGPGTGPGLHACDHWPDRLWFDVGCRPDRSDALRLIDVARAAARPQLLPVWSRDEPHPSGQAQTEGWSLAREFSAAGCKVTFAQTLMALNLAGWRSNAAAASEIKLQEVQRETGDWADVASRSFGYTVPPAVTDHLIEHAGVRLIVARRDGQTVGTGLVYARGATAGLHMVGVVPEARRQGIARKIMLRLLDDAHARGFGLATLQASAMGQGLYRELGFVPQGRILNFQLP